MTTIEYSTYETMAMKLLERIGPSCYFNGSAEIRQGETEVKLICTLIVHRERQVMPEGIADIISDIVPVWWECRSADSSRYSDNDFSWREFHGILMDMA